MRCPRAPVTVGASADRSAVVVEAAVERVGHLGGVADQQRVLAGGGVGLVGGQGVGGHGDRVAAVQAVMGAVPADGAAHRCRAAVAQRQRGGAFGGVAHPPHLRKVLRPGQVGAELGEHAAAGFDRGELVGVADQHGLGARLPWWRSAAGAGRRCRPWRLRRRRPGSAGPSCNVLVAQVIGGLWRW